MRNVMSRQNLSEAQETAKIRGLSLLESTWGRKYPELWNMAESGDAQQMLRAAQTATMLENQQRHMQTLNESVIAQKFADIAPRVLDIIRIAYPNANYADWVNVQTMNGPTDLIYFVKPVYGSTQQGATAGELMVNNVRPTFGSETVTDAIGVGNGTLKTFAGNLSYIPVRPKTVKLLKDNAVVAIDNGKGEFEPTPGNPAIPVAAGANVLDASSINYVTGAVSVTFTVAPGANAEIAVEYSFDAEQAPDRIGQVDLIFSTMPVVARAHKLRFRYSADSSLIAASIDVPVEDTLTLAATQELIMERDLAVFQDLNRIAVDLGEIFDGTAAMGFSLTEHAQFLKVKLAQAYSNPLLSIGRGEVNWLIAGVGLCSYFEALNGFVKEPNVVPIGIFKIGTLNGVPVYKNRFMASNAFLGGYKGDLFGDAGYIVADFVSLYATPTVELDDFIGRKGLASFYDKKVITPQYYIRGTVALP